MIQVNRIYLIFNLVHFLVDSSDIVLSLNYHYKKMPNLGKKNR